MYIWRRSLLCKRYWKLPSVAIAKRRILSSSFAQQENFTKYLKQRKLDNRDQNLSSICLLIDRCSEKNMPFSSLTMDNMVHTIEDKDDIVSSMYYLHKFRHCDACYFTRSWTTHVWVRKCLEFNASDLALKALDENSQYGIFPDDIAYCLLVDKCLKEQNCDLAFKFVSHMFLSETLDTKLAQSLCLFVILKIAERENSLNPILSSLFEQRNFSALCFRVGQLLDNKSLKILGLANLGSIEKEHGIRSVYQEPWAPLMWTDGYFEQAITELAADDKIVVNRAILDHVLDLCKDDETLIESVNEKTAALEAKGLLSNEPFAEALEKEFLPQISELEAQATESFTKTVETWVSERTQISEIEKLIENEQTIERQKHFDDLRLKKLAKKMAVERLGYWEFMADDVENENVPLHLRDDYVAGSSSDIDIERRIDPGRL